MERINILKLIKNILFETKIFNKSHQSFFEVEIFGYIKYGSSWEFAKLFELKIKNIFCFKKILKKLFILLFTYLNKRADNLHFLTLFHLSFYLHQIEHISYTNVI